MLFDDRSDFAMVMRDLRGPEVGHVAEDVLIRDPPGPSPSRVRD
ncbi:hypothetical protein [Nocardia niwae]